MCSGPYYFILLSILSDDFKALILLLNNNKIMFIGIIDSFNKFAMQYDNRLLRAMQPMVNAF